MSAGIRIKFRPNTQAMDQDRPRVRQTQARRSSFTVPSASSLGACRGTAPQRIGEISVLLHRPSVAVGDISRWPFSIAATHYPCGRQKASAASRAFSQSSRELCLSRTGSSLPCRRRRWRAPSPQLEHVGLVYDHSAVLPGMTRFRLAMVCHRLWVPWLIQIVSERIVVQKVSPSTKWTRERIIPRICTNRMNSQLSNAKNLINYLLPRFPPCARPMFADRRRYCLGGLRQLQSL